MIGVPITITVNSIPVGRVYKADKESAKMLPADSISPVNGPGQQALYSVLFVLLNKALGIYLSKTIYLSATSY